MHLSKEAKWRGRVAHSRLLRHLQGEQGLAGQQQKSHPRKSLSVHPRKAVLSKGIAFYSRQFRNHVYSWLTSLFQHQQMRREEIEKSKIYSQNTEAQNCSGSGGLGARDPELTACSLQLLYTICSPQQNSYIFIIKRTVVFYKKRTKY